VPFSEEILEKDKKIRELHSLKNLHFISGKSRDKNTLENANIHKAESVVLLAEDNSSGADERTLLRALAISRFCRLKSKEKIKKTTSENQYKKHKVDKYIDSIYIIAEINDVQFKTDLLDADVNEVVITSSYGKSIITQTMLNHGVSKVLDEVLQFNEYNEFYVIDLAEPENKHLQDKTFDELLLPLRKQKILLIAIGKISLPKSELLHNKNRNFSSLRVTKSPPRTFLQPYFFIYFKVIEFSKNIASDMFVKLVSIISISWIGLCFLVHSELNFPLMCAINLFLTLIDCPT